MQNNKHKLISMLAFNQHLIMSNGSSAWPEASWQLLNQINPSERANPPRINKHKEMLASLHAYLQSNNELVSQ